MKYCKRCVMPSTRPGIKFNEEGLCSACQAYDHRAEVDWKARHQELVALCDKYRGMNGPNGYDCAIAVSGGKDSHFQVYYMKEVMKMNPVLFSVEDNFPMTEAGKHNLKNISEVFGCHIFSLKPDLQAQKKLMRYCFETYGKPTWFLDRLIYTYPMHMALKFNTPLLVYGENVSYEYGGADATETYSARGQLGNGVASDINLEELVHETNVTMQQLEFLKAPSVEQIAALDPMYLSYFLQWNSHENYLNAKAHGFRDLSEEWDRSHTVENYDQVESRGYLVHAWMKYPKFGHACATDYAARYVRYGMMTREEACEAVRLHDHALDHACVKDFCEFLNYSEEEFWGIVDKFYNRDLFEKNAEGGWCLKHPVWEK